MQLRWLVKRYPKASTEEVKKLMKETGKGVEWCKRQLNKPDERILQGLTYFEEWLTIPTVVEEQE